ncbi:hypothetical protein [Chitinasiproducens palmae]|uniref:TIR domain-containing protein n=1 Tax=Chitinasiproducens palmae TaxID=1770053 RepID=A0A1H2PKZ1_9BURK|nr:hypothetical protein [Chitinasiproducens palmae]SDV47141.1 hypothetical protein SAMN05216551_102307 [Chitinasiproducens palmae]
MKTVWITALADEPARVAAVAATLRRYGLQAQAHRWLDEPDKGVARAALDAIAAAEAHAWLVLVSPQTLAQPGVRYGLSLLRASLADGSRPPLPVFCLWPDGGAADATQLPPLLQDAHCAVDGQAAWPAKVVAATARRPNAGEPLPTADYRLTAWGDERIGQWVEIGPRHTTLDGFVFGVCPGDGAPAAIEFQAVGPRGGLPERTTLEYAQQGLTVTAGERTFECWAVRNTIDTDHSYFARLKGSAQALLCMPFTERDDAEASVITLR